MGPEEDDLGSWIGEGETRERQTSKEAPSTDERTLVAAVVFRMGRALSHASLTDLCTPTPADQEPPQA